MARKLDKAIDAEASSITIGFPASGEAVAAKLSDFPEDIVNHLALHGLSQKVTDATAGRDPADAEDHVRKILEALRAGQWTVRGEGGGGGGTRITQLAKAVARIKNMTEAEAAAKIADLSDEQKKALQASASVKATILQIKQEALAEKHEADEGESGEGDAVLEDI